MPSFVPRSAFADAASTNDSATLDRFALLLEPLGLRNDGCETKTPESET